MTEEEQVELLRQIVAITYQWERRDPSCRPVVMMGEDIREAIASAGEETNKQKADDFKETSKSKKADREGSLLRDSFSYRPAWDSGNKTAVPLSVSQMIGA